MPSNVTKQGSISRAIDEVLQLLGVSCMEATVGTDFVKGKRSALSTLHRLFIALCIGNHFEYGRRFVGDLGEIQPDPSKYRTVMETIGGEVNCSMPDALNIVAYTTLEYFRYPRISQITLGEDQDVRELFLAFVFLLSKQHWFKRADKNSPEYLYLRECLVNTVACRLETLSITEKLEKLEFVDSIDSFYARQEGANKSIFSAHIDKDNDSYKLSALDPSVIKGSSLYKNIPLVSFLRSSTHTRCPSQHIASVESTTVVTNNVSSSSSLSNHHTDLVNETSTLKGANHREIFEKGAKGLVPVKDPENRPGIVKTNFNVTDAITKLEDALRDAITDLEVKSQLFSGSKNVETFDTETLRVLYGQNEQQILLNNIMDNNDFDVFSQDTIIAAHKVLKLAPGRAKGNTKENEEEEEADPSMNEITQVMSEIEALSHRIIQMQSRVQRMTEYVEREDCERLCHFHRFSNSNGANGDSVMTKDEGSNKNTTTYDIGDTPTPVELLLLSQKEDFERHVALMNAMNKSLDCEWERSSLYLSAINVLKDIKPEHTNRREARKRDDGNADEIEFITDPRDVKQTVNSLKCFIMDGMPCENFIERSEEPTKDEQMVQDFLRHINSRYAIFRTSNPNGKSSMKQLRFMDASADRGKKTSFINYLNNELMKLEAEGTLDMNLYADTKDAASIKLHLYGDGNKVNPRIGFKHLKKWIQSENDDVNDSYMGHVASTTNIPAIHEDLNVQQLECNDFAVLQNLINYDTSEDGIHHSSESTAPFEAIDVAPPLDFRRYFNLSRDNFLNMKTNKESTIDIPWNQWKENLKEQNMKIILSHRNVLKEAKDAFERIRKRLPSVTLMD